jgi:hypothetical protein
MNHTPGPWTDESIGKDAMVSTHAEADRAMMIDCTRSGCRIKEDQANARLIAAAPDLLEALNRAADTFSDLRKYFGILGKDVTAWELAEGDARAAIAKATQ